MKRWRGVLRGVSISLASLLLVAACGGGGGSSNRTQTPAPAPAPPPPPPPPPVNQSPIPLLSATTADGFVPLPVTFDAAGSSDPDGQIVSYLWEFDDGAPDSTGVSISHTFQLPGSYSVRLTVTDDEGDSATTTTLIRARGAELSGTIQILGSSAVDSDVNDRFTTPLSNNSFVQAQPIPNPVRLGGFVNLPGTGEPGGNLAASGDAADFYAITLTGNEIILLNIGDNDADLELRLWDAGQNLVDESLGNQSTESLTIAAAGDYFIEVFPASGLTNVAGASNYVLSVGQDLTIATRFVSRLSDEFVPGELLLSSHHPSAMAGIQDDYALAEHGRAGRFAKAALTRHTPERVRQRLASKDNNLPRHGRMSALQVQKHQTLMALKQLQRDPAIASAELNLLVQPNLEPDDAFYSLQWHYRSIQLPSAWDLTTGTPTGANDVIVAVVDTGILATHPDFDQQLVTGYDFISDAGRARDGDGIDFDPTDEGDLAYGGSSSFHGTHVAGTVAARSNNADGVAGVAWGAKLMPLRALGVGGGTNYDVIQAVRFAAGLSNDSGDFPAQRADIINLSLGSAFFSAAEQATIDAARAAGVIVIASAGNASSSAPNYPAAYNGVVSVSATTIDNSIAPYSNFGSSIDVAAPGGYNATDLNGDGFADGVVSTLGDDSSAGPVQLGYGALNGTSMAAPHVAGVAALMKALHPGLTPQQFDDALMAGDLTDDLGAANFDSSYGHGLINAQKAVLTALALAGGSGSDPGPVLATSLSAVNLGVLASAQTISLTNVGTGSIVIGTPPVASEAWLTISESSVDPDGLGEYLLTVDRGHTDLLTEGSHNATAEFIPDDPGTNSVTVTVTLRVIGSNPFADAGLHYVILVDPSGATVSNLDVVSASNGEYQFLLSDVPAGSYRIFAGSDMDDDSFLCDGGEACGAYQTLDEVESITVDPASAPTMTDLDFISEFRAVISVSAEGEAAATDPSSGIRSETGLRIEKTRQAPR